MNQTCQLLGHSWKGYFPGCPWVKRDIESESSVGTQWTRRCDECSRCGAEKVSVVEGTIFKASWLTRMFGKLTGPIVGD
jgi:hypothetical protein